MRDVVLCATRARRHAKTPLRDACLARVERARYARMVCRSDCFAQQKRASRRCCDDAVKRMTAGMEDARRCCHEELLPATDDAERCFAVF